MRGLTVLVIIGLWVAGCVRPPEPVDEDTGLPPRLGVPAASLTPDDEREPAGDDEPTGRPPGAGVATAAPGTPTPVPVTEHDVAAAEDPVGDAGSEAPRYVDLVAIGVTEVAGTARFTLDVGTDLPARTAEGEVIGVGIDIYLGQDAGESSYQLFADGGADGWRAYLQTPEGPVEFPGSFRLGGRRMVFEVPWDALGGPRSGELSVFADWSRRRAVLNEAGGDRMPDAGRVRFTR